MYKYLKISVWCNIYILEYIERNFTITLNNVLYCINVISENEYTFIRYIIFVHKLYYAHLTKEIILITFNN